MSGYSHYGVGKFHGAQKELMERFHQHQHNPSIQKLKQSFLCNISKLSTQYDSSPELTQYKLTTIHKMNAAISKQNRLTQCRSILRGGGGGRSMSADMPRHHPYQRQIYAPQYQHFYPHSYAPPSRIAWGQNYGHSILPSPSYTGGMDTPGGSSRLKRSYEADSWSEEEEDSSGDHLLKHHMDKRPSRNRPTSSSDQWRDDDDVGHRLRSSIPVAPQRRSSNTVHRGATKRRRHLYDSPPRASRSNLPEAPPREFSIPIPHRLSTHGPSTFVSGGVERENPSSAQSSLTHIKSNNPALEDIKEELKHWTAPYLLNREKLILMVDLDKTVVNTTPCHLADQFEGVIHLPNSELWTKIRPGARELLSDMSTKYELIVVTMGNRPYAANVVNLLDPHHLLFGKRVITIDDLQNKQSKLEVLDYIPQTAQDMVVIIDDSEAVWGNKPIITVEPYMILEDLVTDEVELRKQILEAANKHDQGANPFETVFQLNDYANYLSTKCRAYLDAIHAACYGKRNKPNPPAMISMLEQLSAQTTHDNATTT